MKGIVGTTNMATLVKERVRLCVKCRICLPLTRFCSRDDGGCDGHKTEKQGGCRYARCGTCSRLPSEGMCQCEHICECFACWEYKDNIDRVAMSQGCRHSICWLCFEDELDLEFQCFCKWMCKCEKCEISRKDESQGCPYGDCITCGGVPGEMDSSCDCDNTCKCFECRDDAQDNQTYLLSAENSQPEYEENEGCKFSTCGVCNGNKCTPIGCIWRCKCRLCRYVRVQELQAQNEGKWF